MNDLIRCTKCGRFEHGYLIDGKAYGDPAIEENWTGLECIECYGPGWSPVGGVEDLKLSVVPALAPFYEAWRKIYGQNTQTLRQAGPEESGGG